MTSGSQREREISPNCFFDQKETKTGLVQCNPHTAPPSVPAPSPAQDLFSFPSCVFFGNGLLVSWLAVMDSCWRAEKVSTHITCLLLHTVHQTFSFILYTRPSPSYCTPDLLLHTEHLTPFRLNTWPPSYCTPDLLHTVHLTFPFVLYTWPPSYCTPDALIQHSVTIQIRYTWRPFSAFSCSTPRALI